MLLLYLKNSFTLLKSISMLSIDWEKHKHLHLGTLKNKKSIISSGLKAATADFSSVRIFCDCMKRSVASSLALCTTENIQMGSPQQLEST